MGRPAIEPQSLETLHTLAFNRRAEIARTGLLNAGERWLIEWQYQEPMGSYEHGLTQALANADGANLCRLYRAYPEHVVALQGYRTVKDYWGIVKHIAGR